MKIYSTIRKKAEDLRKNGRTYAEINEILKSKISKSTMSFWFKNTPLPKGYQRKIEEYNKYTITKAQEAAFHVNKIKRENYLKSLIERNVHLANVLKNIDVCKIVLATLYLGEGAKGIKRGSLYLGNSDPFVIDLFLYLLRKCYTIDGKKFRCTVLCRADQNIKQLERFWSNITKIPLSQFYKARVDARTIGKKTEKLDYKGVCRIDYFSAEIFIELMQIPKIIYKMGP